ncbi:DUF4395 domain-containing protein [Corynebacterium sp. ED61]|uniref:DUF4395 domain-containing protein n=1 Tax=Corynebacterium sp. ED61 TaxID=2211360 RepID=UPI00188389FD|nr:DUF4395 domain-containing protein [Corynebacterium sp. ED61]MBF0581103.1 DUF4395 domain-containing protein [Corynebacterium sp. ED61]
MPFGEFPERVNEHAARTTAMLVIALAVVTIACALSIQGGVTIALNLLLVIGFALRLWAGPKYSLFGQLSVRYLASAAFGEPRIVSGAPKQFAQGIGLVFSVVALLFSVSGLFVATSVTLILLVAAASAEAFLGFCAGCWIYRHAQRAGILPPDACETCAI